MPENKDWINGLILEVTRGRQGSVTNSRKGSIPKDVKTIIDNGVDIDGIEYDFNKVRNILESQGYTEFEIDDFIDEYMLDEMEKQLQ